MKMIRLRQNEGYSNVKEFGELSRDFIETSLMEQLLPHLESMPGAGTVGTDRFYLIFEPEEEDRVMGLLSQLVGGAVINRDLGHIAQGEIIALDTILIGIGRTTAYVPTDYVRVSDTPISKIDNWSLAIE